MAANVGLCVTMTKVWFISSRRRKKSLCNSSADFESRLPEGSSASTTAGWLMRARATAMRCCSPPESSEGLWVFLPVRFRYSSSFSHATDVGGNADVLDGGELRQEVVELKHEADFLVAEGSQLGVIQFADLSAIDNELSAVGLIQCADDVEQGGLACAGSTNDAHNFAFGDMEVDAFEHFEAAVGFMNACRLDRISN